MGIDLKKAKTPKGERVYAIGDIHGCSNELEQLLEMIARDLEAVPLKRHTIVFLGDYIDRGPDSCGVISRLIRLQKSSDRVICLKGNHEEKFLQFLADPDAKASGFFAYGGIETSHSYGVNKRYLNDPVARARKIRNSILKKIPRKHLIFLFDLMTSTTIGDYFFCHAGIRPGIRLRDQSEHDLMWIRNEFLMYGGLFKKVIVHGHTPQQSPEVKANRINIDTRCYDSGVLSCLVLEGRNHRFIQTGNRSSG